MAEESTERAIGLKKWQVGTHAGRVDEPMNGAEWKI